MKGSERITLFGDDGSQRLDDDDKVDGTHPSDSLRAGG
jgi:hypothetical protein